MRVFTIVSILSMTAVCSLAQQARPDPGDRSTASLEKKIGDLERRVAQLESQSTKDDSVELDISKLNAFQRLNSNNSTSFLVSVNKVEKTADGFKVVLSFGNTSTATFKDVDLSLEWGTKPPDGTDETRSDAWSRSLRTTDLHVTKKLYPGQWNKVEIILAPAKADELGYLRLSMQTNTVTLDR
jgi:hypothetical protein